MYCENCGEELQEGVKFCSRCGAVQHVAPGGSQASTSLKRAKLSSKKLPIKQFAVPVIAACAVIALIIAGIATKGFGLFGKPKNPVAVTYDAMKSPIAMKNFAFDMSLSNTDEKLEVNSDGYVYIGKTLDDSIFDYKQEIINEYELLGHKERYEYKERYGFCNGYLFRVEDDDIDVAEYDDIFDEDYAPDFDAAFVKGEVTWGSAVAMFKDYINDSLSDADLDVDIDIEEIDAVWDTLEKFIYDRLSDETVLESVVKNSEVSKLGGITTYSYKLDMQRLVKALYTYLTEEIDSNEVLTDLKDEIEDEEDVNVRSQLKLGRDYLVDMFTYDYTNVKVQVSIDSKGYLQEFKYDMDIDEDDELHFEISFSEIGKIVPNIEELEDIIDRGLMNS
ncbi:MAG: zinc ribbon domain-containing protein [Clostridiales bacterium]|nr:zinc ribbon domain-containing protein [Clostridiales bacterium]